MARFSLIEQFRETAEAAVEAFPERLALPIFTVVGKNTHREIFSTAASRRNMKARDFEHYKEYLLKEGWAGLAINYISIQYIFLDADGARRDKNRRSPLWTFDHEIGHHVVKGALSRHIRAHRREGRAETFAAIRHLQRGGDPAVLDYAETTCAYFLLEKNSIEDCPSESIAAVRAYAQKHDVTKLSLPETAELALEIAEETKLDEKTLKQLIAGKDEDDPRFQRAVALFKKHKEARKAISRPKISALFAPNR